MKLSQVTVGAKITAIVKSVDTTPFFSPKQIILAAIVLLENEKEPVTL